MIAPAREKFPATHFADKLPVSRGDLTAHGYDMRSAFDFHLFEGIVIEIHLVGLG